MDNTSLTQTGALKPADELLAEIMLRHKGNITKVSREPEVSFNAMSLRVHLASNPQVRNRYQELLTQELQEAGLQIGERILKMVEIQNQAFGDVENGIPTDTKAVIDLSKHISELLKEAKGYNVSDRSAVLITSKEDASELLKEYLTS